MAGLHRPHGRRLTSARSWSARLAGKSSRDAVVPGVTLSLSWSGACSAGQSCRLPHIHRGVRTAHVPADLWERCMWWAQSSCSNVPRGRRPDARGAALRHRAAAPGRRRTGLLRSPLAVRRPIPPRVRPARSARFTLSTARTADAATGAGRLGIAVVAGASDVAIRPRPRPVTAAGFSGLVGSSSPGCR